MKKPFKPILAVVVTICFFGEGSAQAPYALSRTKDGWLLGSGTAAAVAGFAAQHSVDPLSLDAINRLSREDINAFDRRATNFYSTGLSTGSDVLVGTLLVFPAALFISNDAFTVGVMYAETVMFTGAASFIAKGLVQRTRPFAYNPTVPIEKKREKEARRSFFSGHTAAAFSAAVFTSTVFSAYHPDSKWQPVIWSTSLLTASIVGGLRYRSGQHFPTDILAGTVLGSTLGYLIPHLHKTTTSGLGVAPAIDGKRAGIMLQYAF